MKKLTKPIVLISHTLPEEWVESLNGKCQLFVGPKDANTISPELLEHLKDASGMYTLLTIKVSSEMIQRASHLRVLSNMAVGVDNIDVAACTLRGIPVGNTPGVLTEGTADLTIALLLSAARRLPEARQAALEGQWKTWSPTGWLGADLNGATLGIIGMGKIGRAVARRALGFGMRIVYTDSQPWDEFASVQLPLNELLEQSDFISLHVPLSKDTHHLINASRLEQMKPNAILINTSRGPVVDTDALTCALVDHKIAGAALDVTDPEPLPPQHPLYHLPSCLILPHIGSATQNTRRRMAELACENLLAGLEGRRLPNCVNPDVYSPR
jgi:glyoxylate reductase